MTGATADTPRSCRRSSNQRHLANPYPLVQRLGHVVHRQCRDGRRHHRLHLHAVSPRSSPPSPESARRPRPPPPPHPQSSAPADGTSGSAPLSALPPGSPRTAPPPADSPSDFSAAPPAPPCRQLDKRLRHSLPPRLRLRAHIHHPRLPRLIVMAQLVSGPSHSSSARSARIAIRIQPSPPANQSPANTLVDRLIVRKYVAT